jgi:DNA-binding GntR family transcriptional regulator
MEWSLDDVREIYELRALLEGHGAARAAVRMEEADIAKLDALCDEMERLARRRQQRDYERITELNAELHRCILESSASTRLVTVLGAVVQVPLVVHTFRRYTPQSLARSMSHHRDLVAAIRAHDSEWAASTMRSHIFAALATLNDEYRRAVN